MLQFQVLFCAHREVYRATPFLVNSDWRNSSSDFRYATSYLVDLYEIHSLKNVVLSAVVGKSLIRFTLAKTHTLLTPDQHHMLISNATGIPSHPVQGFNFSYDSHFTRKGREDILCGLPRKAESGKSSHFKRIFSRFGNGASSWQP